MNTHRKRSDLPVELEFPGQAARVGREEAAPPLEGQPSIAGAVRSFLEAQPALSLFTCREIFGVVQGILPGVRNPSLREAVQRLAFGSSMARRRNMRSFSAIYVHLPEIRALYGFDDAYLTLPAPGVERTCLENCGEGRIQQIQAELAEVYGAESIRYWGGAAQDCSAGLVEPRVLEAVWQRPPGGCALCAALAGRFQRAGRPAPEGLGDPAGLAPCPIIPRRALFWQALLKMHQSLLLSNVSIFSDAGVKELRRMLALPPADSGEVPGALARLHSSAEFCVLLCGRHARAVQEALGG